MHELTNAEALAHCNLQASRSPNTRRAYAAAARSFEDFAGGYPADPWTVGKYLSVLAERCARSTVRLHMAAIADAHRSRGLDSPTEHGGVTLILSGAMRRSDAVVVQATGIDADAFEAISGTAMYPRRTRGGRMETMNEARSRALVDVSLIGLMRDAMLRRSEASAATWDDFSIEKDGSGRLVIRSSKTDQDGAGCVRYVSDGVTGCLRALRTITGGDGSIFGMCDRQICRRIAAAAKQAELPGTFSGHSPRIGMAQDLAAAGVGLPALMEAGRWKSADMPAYYIRSIEAGRGAVATWYGERS